MKLLVAIALLGNLGSENFQVDPQATILDYSQSTSFLRLEGSDRIGGTLGGYFTIPQNYSNIPNLGLIGSIVGENQNSLFSIELYSGEELSLVGIYEASTEAVPTPETPTAIELNLVQSGPGSLNDIRGLQFTWLGEGNPVDFTLISFVDLNPPNPEITFCGFQGTGFTIRWKGTGNRPTNVQRTTDLRTGNWITIASNITSQEYTDMSTPINRAFYRVVVP